MRKKKKEPKPPPNSWLDDLQESRVNEGSGKKKIVGRAAEKEEG